MEPSDKCTKCKYWKRLGDCKMMYCSYMLENGHSRLRKEGECLSYESKRKKPVPR